MLTSAWSVPDQRFPPFAHAGNVPRFGGSVSDTGRDCGLSNDLCMELRLLWG